MNRRAGIALVLFLVVAGLVVFFARQGEEGPQVPADPSETSLEAGGGVANESGPATEIDRTRPELSGGLKEDLSRRYLRGYGEAAAQPERDLMLIGDLVEALRSTVKVPGAVPTSGNRDLVSALVGNNAYQIRFLDPEFKFLNSEGELVDRWQSPLYFHFVDSTDVGVRSAGPDQQMWTADDLVRGENAVE